MPESQRTTDVRLNYDKLRFSVFAHARHCFAIGVKPYVALILADLKPNF